MLLYCVPGVCFPNRVIYRFSREILLYYVKGKVMMLYCYTLASYNNMKNLDLLHVISPVHLIELQCNVSSAAAEPTCETMNNDEWAAIGARTRTALFLPGKDILAIMFFNFILAGKRY